MKLKSSKQLVFLAVGFLITIIAYLWFIKTPFFQSFTVWSQHNLLVFLITLLAIKVLGIVWPPIPGGILTLGAIPIIGWETAYTTDFLGSLIGSSIAFYLGKKYGYKFLKNIFDVKTLEKIQKTKVVSKREIEGVFVMRTLTGSTISEAVCYGAGLLKIKYKNFLIGSTLSHLATGIPAYYLASSFFTKGNFTINIVFILIALPLLIWLRKRYFE